MRFLRWSLLRASLLLLVMLMLVGLGRVGGHRLRPAHDQIVFTSNRTNNNEIYLLDLTSSIMLNLSERPGGDHDPAWSPDGERVLFTSTRDGVRQIFGIDIFTRQVVLLSGGVGVNRMASFTPDGRKILFQSLRDGQDWDIFVMDADGSNPVNLTLDSEASDELPRWSPDGSQIVFISFRNRNNEVYVMNADGSNQRNVSVNRADDNFPRWSLDGSQILFRSGRMVNGYGYYAVPADCYVAPPYCVDSVEPIDSALYDQVVSPDGSRVLYIEMTDDGGGLDVFLRDVDGSNVRRLTNHPTIDFQPSWRP